MIYNVTLLAGVQQSDFTCTCLCSHSFKDILWVSHTTLLCTTPQPKPNYTVTSTCGGGEAAICQLVGHMHLQKPGLCYCESEGSPHPRPTRRERLGLATRSVSMTEYLPPHSSQGRRHRQPLSCGRAAAAAAASARCDHLPAAWVGKYRTAHPAAAGS